MLPHTASVCVRIGILNRPQAIARPLELRAGELGLSRVRFRGKVAIWVMSVVSES